MSKATRNMVRLSEAHFTQAAFSRVAGIPMPTINNWIQSGAVRPGEVANVVIRSAADASVLRRLRRPRLFSPIAMYEAVVTDVLVKLLNASPLTCAAIARRTTHDQTWMRAVAESKKPIDYFQIVFWSDRRRDWDSWLGIAANDVLKIDLKVAAKQPIIVLPVSKYLAAVLEKCQQILNSTPKAASGLTDE